MNCTKAGGPEKVIFLTSLDTCGRNSVGPNHCCRKKMSSSDQWSYVLIIILLVPTTLADLERTCSSDIEHRGAHPAGLCGSQLSEILGMICIWGYNLPEKRGDERDYNQHGSQLRSIILGKREAFSYLSKRSAYPSGPGFQGIVCECCYNQCTYDEMTQYCLDKRKKRDITNIRN